MLMYLGGMKHWPEMAERETLKLESFLSMLFKLVW